MANSVPQEALQLPIGSAVMLLAELKKKGQALTLLGIEGGRIPWHASKQELTPFWSEQFAYLPRANEKFRPFSIPGS